MSEYYLKSEEQLRSLFGEPSENSLNKEKDFLDSASREFIENSPFLTLATVGSHGQADCSPKGDPVGNFVKILSEKKISIPDRKGNNRLDSLSNIIQDKRVGLLFFIPGRRETLRLNGEAVLSIAPDDLEIHRYQDKLPHVAILIDIKEVYLHCPKALIRSNFWEQGVRVTPHLESYIEAMGKQLNLEFSAEEIKRRAKDYQDSLKERLY